MSSEASSVPSSGAELMRRWTCELPAQILRALEQAERSGWPMPAAPVHAVYLGGMGGSGMACELARSILSDTLPVPCEVHHCPEPPAWVGPGTLAGVVSYSGETWEARRMIEVCLQRGASVFVVAGGGRILDTPGLPARARFEVPREYAPRAALGWMLVPVLLAASGAESGAVRDALAEAVDLLEEELALWREGEALPHRDPKELAAMIRGRFSVVYAPSESFRPLGVRWKNQLLENGKQAAWEGAFPELAHNEVMGWEFAARRDAAFLLLEEGGSETGPAARVREAARAELAASGAEITRVAAHGEGLGARLLTHVALADWTSLELASLLGVDPLPIPAIQRVKAACGKELFG